MAADFTVRGGAMKLVGRHAEREVLDRLIEAVRAGESRALVLSGEAGVGKTALLDYLAGRASEYRVERAVGVQSEMELPFAALHPLTIISTLPSAGLGALLALQVTNTPLTVIAFVGIILLIGLVKKNGIMMVDFALDAERNRGLSSADAIFEACKARFRPILMTTMAALFAGIPLVIATGPGTELRRPLGITIIGGLFVSQILTLYTTPVIYLLIDRLRRRRGPGAACPRRRNRFADLAGGAREAYRGQMSEQSETRTLAAEAVPDCPRCLKPLPLCICDSVTPIESRISLLILQHPQEQDRALGTARLTALHFKNAVVKIGLSWPSLSKALGRPVADPSRWAVLYLGSAKAAELDTEARDRRAEPQGRGRGAPARHPRATSRAWCCWTGPGARPRRCGGAMRGC